MSIATDTQPCIVLLGDRSVRLPLHRAQLRSLLLTEEALVPCPSITQFSNVPDGLATKMNGASLDAESGLAERGLLLILRPF